jgi:geranylgeranyl reductase
MKLSAQVLVVGGGPAGATAARFLSQSGVDVLLLEKNLSFVKPCGGGIPSSCFEDFDIPKGIIKKHIKKIRIISPKGEIVDIALQGGDIKIIERGEFDRILRNEAKKKGARIIEGEFLLLRKNKIFTVEALIDKKKTEVFSEYIIAADGVNSRVRTALGIKPSQALFVTIEYFKGIHPEVCEFWFGSSHAPGFYSWIFPKGEGFSAGTGCFESGKINILFERFKERKGITEQGNKKIYRIPLWRNDLYNKGKALFIGDSAGQVLPFTYEGIYYAMTAGELAAQAIFEGKSQNYKKMWKARFQKRFAFMDYLRKHFLKDDASSEKLVALHRRPEVQEASMRLWLMKERGQLSLKRYVKLFGKFLCCI